ncbi:MAG: hypothetical protein EBZ05_08405, partial [Verrucomicrobia bacterium]|nr:hypothetical protein [Verrucomicrobiota bacterium]
NANGIVDTAANSLTMSGVISGTGRMSKNGSGVLTLTATNTYGGGTLMNAGTLALGNSGAVGTGGIQFAGNSTVLALADLALSNNLSINTGITGVFDSGAFTNIVSGTISGAGAFSKQGSGKLTLTADNSYAGTTTVSAGILQIGDGGATGTLGSTNANVVVNGTLVFNRSGTNVIANTISGTGTLIQEGPGELQLTAVNTYTNTIVNNGSLRLTKGGVAGALRGTLTINENGLVIADAHDALGWYAGGVSQKIEFLNINGGTLRNIYAANNLTLDGVEITMRGGLIESTATTPQGRIDFYAGQAASTLRTLASSNTAEFRGNLRLRENQPMTVFTVDEGSAATDFLLSANVVNMDWGGNLSPGKGITKAGAGLMRMSGSNAYSGATIVSGGTLQAGSTTAFGSASPLTLSNTAGVLVDLDNYNVTIGSLSGGGSAGGNVTLGSGNLTVGADNGTGSFGGVISGTGAVTKRGTGTQTLTGQNTFSGLFTQNQGVTVLANSNGPALFNGQGGKVVVDNIYGN